MWRQNSHRTIRKKTDRSENGEGEESCVGCLRGMAFCCAGRCMENKRILGLDFGSRTVGVAVSDPLGITAQGVETIERPEENKLRKTCARIEQLIREYGVGTIVLGCPKNMNNTEGERVEKTLAFRDMLARRTGLAVEMWD